MQFIRKLTDGVDRSVARAQRRLPAADGLGHVLLTDDGALGLAERAGLTHLQEVQRHDQALLPVALAQR